MDSNFNAKLRDFGLARLVDHELGSQTIVLAGTMGYLSPECVTTGKASRESDVYSFGVVALEIICGRRPAEPRAEPSKTRLVEWVWRLYGKGQLLEAVDKGLSMEFDQRQMECLMTVGLWSCQWTRGCLWLEAVYKVLSMEFDQRQMECLMTVGLWCCHADSTHRPSTRQVINVLSFEAPPPNLPMTMPVPMYFAPPMHMCKFSYTSSATPTDSQWHQSGCSCNTCTSDSSMSLGSSKALLKLPKPDVWYLIVFQL